MERTYIFFTLFFLLSSTLCFFKIVFERPLCAFFSLNGKYLNLFFFFLKSLNCWSSQDPSYLEGSLPVFLPDFFAPKFGGVLVEFKYHQNPTTKFMAKKKKSGGVCVAAFYVRFFSLSTFLTSLCECGVFFSFFSFSLFTHTTFCVRKVSTSFTHPKMLRNTTQHVRDNVYEASTHQTTTRRGG